MPDVSILNVSTYYSLNFLHKDTIIVIKYIKPSHSLIEHVHSSTHGNHSRGFIYLGTLSGRIGCLAC